MRSPNGGTKGCYAVIGYESLTKIPYETVQNDLCIINFRDSLFPTVASAQTSSFVYRLSGTWPNAVEIKCMKLSFFLITAALFSSAVSHAQTADSFDIATFKAPKGWTRQVKDSSVQFSVEDTVNGTYAVMSMPKSLPGPGSPLENFRTAWGLLVKGSVNPSAPPQMLPSANEGAWALEVGYAPFEKEGEKGVAMLATISGSGTMMNVLILTNTQAYEKDITAFLESIDLKKPAPAPPAKVTPVTSPASASGYGFATTNFDDGWISTVQEDWVRVSRGTTNVLIHYPNKQADVYNSVLMDGLKNAWDVLVAPRYATGRNLEFKPITGWQSIEFAEGDLTEKGTGKSVHVVLFKMNYSNGNSRYLEFITPTKQAFEQEFGAYQQKTSGWEKLERMADYNRFGVAASDLKGKWTNDFSGALSYVNAYTGASAGTSTHASLEHFSFGPGGSYTWDLGVASGFVGNIKFQGVKSSGRATVPGIWKITFSSIEGKPRTYDAHFSSIRGGRILWLDGRPFGKLN
jgi:hypothetical protein